MMPSRPPGFPRVVHDGILSNYIATWSKNIGSLYVRRRLHMDATIEKREISAARHMPKDRLEGYVLFCTVSGPWFIRV